MLKKCKTCGEPKELKDFYSQNRVSKYKEEYIYYQPECKNCSINRTKKWTSDNPEWAKKIYNDKFARLPKDKIKERNHRYRKKYYENGKYNKWIEKNPKKMTLYREKRKLKSHEISVKEWEECKKYFNNACAYCEMSWEEHKQLTNKDLHKEHVVEGGKNDLRNCVPSCRSCNSSKSEQSLNEWYDNGNPNFRRSRYMKIYNWIRFDHSKYLIKKIKRKIYSPILVCKYSNNTLISPESVYKLKKEIPHYYIIEIGGSEEMFLKSMFDIVKV